MTMPPEPSRVNPSPGEQSTAAKPDISVAEVAPQATAAHPLAGHETTDIHVPLVLKMLAALLVAVILSAWGLERLAAHYERSVKRSDPPRSPMAESHTPPPPRLQAQPRDALTEFRVAEETRLNGYRWVDRSKQTVELPIERAMQLLAERGIPSPAPPAATGAATPNPPPITNPSATEPPR